MASTSAVTDFDGATAVGFENAPYINNDQSPAPPSKGKLPLSVAGIEEALPFVDQTTYLSVKR